MSRSKVITIKGNAVYQVYDNVSKFTDFIHSLFTETKVNEFILYDALVGDYKLNGDQLYNLHKSYSEVINGRIRKSEPLLLKKWKIIGVYRSLTVLALELDNYSNPTNVIFVNKENLKKLKNLLKPNVYLSIYACEETPYGISFVQQMTIHNKK
jgi:hypothetical protein